MKQTCTECRQLALRGCYTCNRAICDAHTEHVDAAPPQADAGDVLTMEVCTHCADRYQLTTRERANISNTHTG